MGIRNAEIADAFDELGDLLSLRGENPFRIRAYRRAARFVRTLPQELAEQKTPRSRDALLGIGRVLTAKVTELIESGRLDALEKLRREVPPGARDLLSLPGMGPARVRTLMTALEVRNREDLKRVLASGQLGMVRGFGETLQSRLREALAVQPPPP